jgi:hypothetical protein
VRHWRVLRQHGSGQQAKSQGCAVGASNKHGATPKKS